MQRLEREVEVVVPASTANLGPGFDSIGMALNLFVTVRIKPAEKTKVFFHGDILSSLSADEDNLILQAMRKIFSLQGRTMPPFHLHVWSDIPLARGLGSSSAALVAGLVLANDLLGEVYSRGDLLQIGTAWEGHPDNIGPCLLGGVIIGSWDGVRASVVQVSPPPLAVVAVVPHFELATEKARGALPEHLPFPDAVLSSSKANVLTAALIKERWDLLETAMRDFFHQPYRMALIPGMEEALASAAAHGALGIALSGAGPTLLAFTREKEKTAQFLADTFTRFNSPASIYHLTPWKTGAMVRLTEEERACKVMGKTN